MMRPHIWILTAASCLPLLAASTTKNVTFHKDVAPILEKRCQGCHHPGDIAPMSLMTYQQARPWAKAIRTAVLQKKMPPWFADPHYGKFSNDSSLTQSELDTLIAWADSGAPEGNLKEAPKPLEFSKEWHIGTPDAIVEVPQAFHVPAEGTVPYQYIAVPTGFTEDKWVQAVEIQPSNRAVVHHIIGSVRAGGSPGKKGEYFTFDIEKARVAGQKAGQEPPMFSSPADSEVLEVFVPGGAHPQLPKGQARFVKAGSELLFQLHYTADGKPEEDRTRIGFIFAKEPPTERIKSVLVFNTHFTIPAGDPNHEIEARAILKNDVKLTSLLPHMHLRGRDFEYRAIYPSGESEVLLRVPRYDFHWQLTYYLEKPKLLPKGAILEVIGHYDNSANNANNPNPNIDVSYGEQTWEEMLNGFMEVAIEPVAKTPEIFGPAAAQAARNVDSAPNRHPLAPWRHALLRAAFALMRTPWEHRACRL
jgi:hypothetical protein